MKTTLVIRDDILRRAKARAALRGQALARYIEEGLEQRLAEEEAPTTPLAEWLHALPEVSEAALSDLDTALEDDQFRVVDPGMWT